MDNSKKGSADDWEEVPVEAKADNVDDWEEVVSDADSGPEIQIPYAPEGAAAGLGAAGYFTTRKLTNAAAPVLGNLADKGLKAMGQLEEGDIDFIRNNPTQYKSAQSLVDTLDEFKNLSQDVANTTAGAGNHITNNLRKTAEETKDAGYKFAKEAKQSLAGQAPMPKQSYQEAVLDGLKKSTGAMSDITPESQAAFLEENYNKPLLQHKAGLEKQAQKMQAEIEMLKAQLDPNDLGKYVELNKEIKARELALKKLPNSTSEYAQKLTEQLADTYQKNVVGLPKELIDLDPELGNKSLNEAYRPLVDRAVAYSTDPLKTLNAEFVGGESGLIPLLRENANFDKTGGAGPVDRVATNISESVRAKAGEIYPEYGEKMSKSHEAIKAKEALEKSGIKIDNEGDVNLAASRSKKIKDIYTNPDLYPDEYKQLTDAVEQTRPFSQQQPLDFVQGRLQQATNVEQGLKSFGIKVDKFGNVEIPDSARERLTTLVKSTDEVDQAKLRKLEALLTEAKSLSSAPKFDEAGKAIERTGADLITDLRAGDIKNTVKTAGSLGQNLKNRLPGLAGKSAVAGLAGSQLGGTEGAVAGLALGAGLDIYGTKLQEKTALAAGSKMGKLAGTVAKEGIPILGGLAAGALGYSAASEAGFEPETAAAIGAVETVNPIPFTDVAQAAVKGKEDWEKNKSVPSAALAAAGGFVSPVATVADSMEDFGKERSLEARARMAKRLNTPDVVKKPHEDFKTFVDKNPDALKDLADKLSSIDSSAAQSYAAPLLKAAEADERSRAAILFGLYQQPAFRQLHKDVGDDENEESGPWNGLTDLKKN